MPSARLLFIIFFINSVLEKVPSGGASHICDGKKLKTVLIMDA